MKLKTILISVICLLTITVSYSQSSVGWTMETNHWKYQLIKQIEESDVAYKLTKASLRMLSPEEWLEFMTEDDEAQELYNKMVWQIVFNFRAVAHHTLYTQYGINTELGKSDIEPLQTEVAKFLLLSKSDDFNIDNVGFSAPWAISFSKKYATEILHIMQSTDPQVNLLYYTFVYADFSDEARQFYMTSFEDLLKEIYGTVHTNGDGSSTLYDLYKIWACCYILYNVNLDEFAIKDIQRTKSIKDYILAPAENRTKAIDLSGRQIIGSLPLPAYYTNVQGCVVVEITVDANGKVVNAVYQSQGSTTNDSGLVNAALNAARKAQFSAVSGEEMQTGTITYNFKLN